MCDWLEWNQPLGKNRFSVLTNGLCTGWFLFNHSHLWHLNTDYRAYSKLETCWLVTFSFNPLESHVKLVFWPSVAVVLNIWIQRYSRPPPSRQKVDSVADPYWMKQRIPVLYLSLRTICWQKQRVTTLSTHWTYIMPMTGWYLVERSSRPYLSNQIYSIYRTEYTEKPAGIRWPTNLSRSTIFFITYCET